MVPTGNKGPVSGGAPPPDLSCIMNHDLMVTAESRRALNGHCPSSLHTAGAPGPFRLLCPHLALTSPGDCQPPAINRSQALSWGRPDRCLGLQGPFSGRLFTPSGRSPPPHARGLDLQGGLLPERRDGHRIWGQTQQSSNLPTSQLPHGRLLPSSLPRPLAA